MWPGLQAARARIRRPRNGVATLALAFEHGTGAGPPRLDTRPHLPPLTRHKLPDQVRLPQCSREPVPSRVPVAPLGHPDVQGCAQAIFFVQLSRRGIISGMKNSTAAFSVLVAATSVFLVTQGTTNAQRPADPDSFETTTALEGELSARGEKGWRVVASFERDGAPRFVLQRPKR